jgi:hypothetical protein
MYSTTILLYKRFGSAPLLAPRCCVLKAWLKLVRRRDVLHWTCG